MELHLPNPTDCIHLTGTTTGFRSALMRPSRQLQGRAGLPARSLDLPVPLKVVAPSGFSQRTPNVQFHLNNLTPPPVKAFSFDNK